MLNNIVCGITKNAICSYFYQLNQSNQQLFYYFFKPNCKSMTLREICETVKGEVVCGEELLGTDVEFAFSSDLMSDVLTVQCDKLILITGLSNLQSIRTAEMSDIPCVLIVRNKPITTEMVELAKECDIAILRSKNTLFFVAGELYKAGLKPVY